MTPPCSPALVAPGPAAIPEPTFFACPPVPSWFLPFPCDHPGHRFSDLAVPGLRTRSGGRKPRPRGSAGGPPWAGAGAHSAGPGAAEVAPPRPGTLAPGADGMTDSATANGDDRDPEIELFVKVGRRLGARGTRGVAAAHVRPRGSRWGAGPSPGRAAQPWRSPGWPCCEPEPGLRAPGRMGSGAAWQVAVFLESPPAVCVSRRPRDRRSPLRVQSPAPREVGFS